jgi:FtsP/CotA-like multicopper oxidase with cupredoxin domain
VGAIQVTDGRDDERGLPSTYGVNDLTLILQDRRLDRVGGMAYEPTPTDALNGFHGNRMFINGQTSAVAVVPPGIARLRFVNGSNARTYGLAFDDRRPMHLVGTDGGLLPAPQALTFLRLAPGERCEVLVDFADGGAPRMVNTRANEARLLDFAVDTTQRPRITTLPGAVGDALPDLPEPAVIREFALNMGGASLGESDRGHVGHAHSEGGPDDFGINGRPYDMERIDFEVPLGSVERWVVSGGGGIEHPFHVHGVHFRVLRNGGTAPHNVDVGWKDTVLVRGQAELLIRFTRPADAAMPFMYHCHILEHEDAGMMGQFIVR